MILEKLEYWIDVLNDNTLSTETLIIIRQTLARVVLLGCLEDRKHMEGYVYDTFFVSIGRLLNFYHYYTFMQKNTSSLQIHKKCLNLMSFANIFTNNDEH